MAGSIAHNRTRSTPTQRKGTRTSRVASVKECAVRMKCAGAARTTVGLFSACGVSATTGTANAWSGPRTSSGTHASPALDDSCRLVVTGPKSSCPGPSCTFPVE
eukprot:1097295-Rhodomonas_salina.2